METAGFKVGRDYGNHWNQGRWGQILTVKLGTNYSCYQDISILWCTGDNSHQSVKFLPLMLEKN
jgi:hypothetical protein